jgi:peroxiredoxin
MAVLVACVLAASSIHAGLPAAEPSGLPRYHLSPGQEVTYIATADFQYQRGTLKSGSKNIYDVVAVNPDGGWHVIGRLESWMTQGGRPPQPDTELIAFDLHPDGRTALSPGVTARRGVQTDFPTLPEDPSQLTQSWGGDWPYGGHVDFKPSPATLPKLFEFAGSISDPIDRIYQITRQTTYHFDSARGILISTTSTWAQGYGFVGKGTGVSSLTNDVAKPKKWLDQFARDCETYFATKAQCAAIREKARLDPGRCDSEFATAKDLLTAAMKQTVSPEIISLLDREVTELPRTAQYIKRNAENLKAVLNEPAPGWTLADQSGAKHSLTDYRGKVVVLDFWYRGCGWCMRAMPEIKQMAADFAGKPVAVLGMNTDSKPADARFVVDAFGLDYPILHVEQQIVNQYHVEGFPTVIVIGPDGVVRDVEEGYSPALRDVLATKIAALIPAK